MTHVVPRLAVLTLVLAIFAACAGTGGDANDSPAWTTAFASAGDTIIARSTGALPDTGSHQLIEVWRIGDAEGLDSTVTFGRLSAFAVHSDNSVAVFDESGPALRVFDAAGNFLRSLGRKGAGPGEYTRANGITFLPDGRLALWDPPTSRVTLYGTDGSNTAWDPPTTGVFLNDALSPAEGYAFVVQESLPDSSASEDDPRRSQTAYFFYNDAGQIVDTVRVPRPANPPRPLVVATEQMMMISNVPFMPSPSSTALSDGRIAMTFGDHYHIDITHGPQPMTIEREVAPVPVAATEAEDERARTERAMRRADPNWVWDGPEVPSTKPAIARLHASADGRLWVHVSSPGELIPENERDEPRAAAPNAPPPLPPRAYREPVWFDVYEHDGTLLGRIVMPTGSTFLGARGDLVWGVTRDELDVPYLTQWRVSPGWDARGPQ